MGAKRALIVDDSKSARHFLSRLLTQYGIESDDAESAEEAIEYLKTHRPDVIFMDHLMPGMDGFQAVQVIKSNPQTATIPIMMYTSQEGELYLGQARALGAVSVLPKQIKPADVSKVLFELRLVPDRRSTEPSPLRPVEVDAHGDVNLHEPPAAKPEPPPPLPVSETVLREQLAELRRALVSNLDSQAERITGEVRALLRDTLPPPPPPPEPASPRTLGWVAAGAMMLAIALATSVLWLREAGLRRALEAEMRQLREAQFAERQARELATPPVAQSSTAPGSSALMPAVISSTPSLEQTPRPAEGLGSAGMASIPVAGTSAATNLSQPSAANAASPAGRLIVESVPYGSDPLNGARHERVQQLLNELAEKRYQGTVQIRMFPGRFCLVGNAVDGYSLAPDEMLYSACDVVGNPHDDALTHAQRMPLQLANLIGELQRSTQGALEVQVTTGSAAETAEPYPPVTEHLTAGEWNRAASANNRIEIQIR